MLTNGTEVKIKNTTSGLDGASAKIVGITLNAGKTTFYIIQINNWSNLGLEYPCMQMIEHCLEVV